MVYSKDINEDLFNRLVECIKNKGVIITNRHYSESNKYVLFINGEIKRYINVFEAFNNLYAAYNCKKNLHYVENNYELTKNGLKNKIFIEDEDTSRKKETLLFKYLEDFIIKDVFFAPLTDMEKHNLELKITESNISNKKKVDILKNIKSMINIKYQQDIYVMSIHKRVSYKKILNTILSFFDRVIYKYED